MLVVLLIPNIPKLKKAANFLSKLPQHNNVLNVFFFSFFFQFLQGQYLQASFHESGSWNSSEFISFLYETNSRLSDDSIELSLLPSRMFVLWIRKSDYLKS